MSGPCLTVRNLSKRFGGLLAVNDVSFEVRPHEILGVLGPNGAGKTTLFNLLTGFAAPDRGEVHLDGECISGLPPHRVVGRGVTRTFQLCRPFAGMTVRENVVVGCLSPRARRETPHPEQRALELLALVNLAAKSELPVETLTYGDLRRLELARALATRPRVLLLDEPFAGLGTAEIGPLAELIRRLHEEQGVSIVLIEHKLREFMQLVGRVIVLEFGEIIASGPPAEIVKDPKVIAAYIGGPVDGRAAAAG